MKISEYLNKLSESESKTFSIFDVPEILLSVVLKTVNVISDIRPRVKWFIVP